MKTIQAIAVLAISVTAVPISSAQLLLDDFNADTSANYNIVTSSPDTAVTFAFDYGTALGIPPAPNTTDGTTLGLKMEANIVAPALAEAVTLHTSQLFTGDRVIKFDAWINANGPFPGGGGGSTEFLTAGVGGDGLTVNLGTTSGFGGWFAVTGEGGSSRDYRAYKDSGEQFAESTQFAAGTTSAGGGSHNASDPYYAQFGNVDVSNLPVQGVNNGGPAQQNGITQPGAFGMEWHEVVILIDADGGSGGATSVRWSIDGLTIATLNAGIGASFSSDGAVTIGYMDIFGTSISDNASLSFGLVDNLEVFEAAINYGSNPAHPTWGPALLVPTTTPELGGNGGLDLSYAAGGGELAALLIDTQMAMLPLFDGTLLVFPPILNTLSFTTTPPLSNFSFPIPADPFLKDAPLFFQAIIVDTVMPQSPFGFVYSDGLQWRLWQ